MDASKPMIWSVNKAPGASSGNTQAETEINAVAPS
jgi:hypothetical protein